MRKPPEMTRCSLFQAVEYLAFGKEPDPAGTSRPPDASEKNAFDEAAERFVYLINHEYGTGINVPLWGIPEGKSGRRRINLIFLLGADAGENRIRAREYGVRLSESVFAEEDAHETIKTVVFNDVQVELDALKRLAAFYAAPESAEKNCKPGDWEKLFFAMACQNAGNDFADQAAKTAEALFGRKISSQQLNEKIRRMKAEIKRPE